MDDSFAPQTYAFKLKCPKCQKKVKKLLSRLNGVHSIKVEGEAGRVTVKSSVDLNTLAAAIGEVMEEQKYSCEGLTSPPSGPANEQENKKYMPHESKAATGPSRLGAPNECVQVESMPHSAEFVLGYGGPYYYTPGPYHQLAMPPYHGYYHHYPPPPYHGYQAAPPPRMPPAPAKVNNDVTDLSCEYASKCRMM